MNNERFPNGSLDRWLRDHADNADEHPAPDGWDAPSGQVWTRVREGLQRRKRRRRRFIFWWMACAVFTLGSLAVWQSRGAAPKPATNPIRETVPVLPSPQAAPPLPSAGRQEPAQPAAAAPVFSSKMPHDKPAESTILNFKNQNAAPLPHPVFSETAPLTQPPAPETNPLAAMLPATPLPGFVRPVFSDSTFHLPTSKVQMPNSTFRNPPSKIEVSATGGLFFTTRTLRGGTAGRLNGRESGAWTWQGGLTVSRALGRHWSVETGLQRTAIRLRAERRGVVRFRSDQERYDPGRDVYETSTRQEVQTSFGAVALRVDLGRQAGQVIHHHEMIRIALHTDERVGYLRLPLGLRYTAGGSRWQWSAQAGLGLNLRTDYDLTVTAARADRVAIRTVSARAERQAAGLAPALVDAQASLRLSRGIGRGWSASVEPAFRYGLGSMTRHTGVQAYPVSAGIQLGLHWRLP